MVSDGWHDMALGEFTTLQRGHDLTASERRPGTVPVMGSAGVAGYHDTSLAKVPGVAIGRSGVGSMGVASYSPVDYWPHNTVLYVTDFRGNDERFTYYFLHHLDLRRFNSGSAQASLNRNFIYPLRILVPELREQKAIAHVLGTLDDTIDLNRRMSRTLERVARAIFRAWFVDFEPVKAKAAGARSFPGMPQEAFDALPTRLVESELGRIPEGWIVGAMGDIGCQRREQVAPEDAAEGTAYIGLEHMPRRSIGLTEWGTADAVTSAKSRFSTGDILFGKLRPYFHKVGPAPVDGICSTDIVVLSAKRTDGAAWLLMLVSSDEFISHANQTSAGTKMPRTNWKDMARFPVALPPADLLRVFQQIAGPMLDLIRQSIHESRKLAVLRDYLLPKLLRGEVRVAEAENTAGGGA